MSEGESTQQQIATLLKMQDGFSKATPSQESLEGVPINVLPADYRNLIRLRQDRNSFYVAFSENPEDLNPTDEGLVPNAHLRQIPVMTGPRKIGSIIKDWIDAIRQIEVKQK